ncbi:helix-turn-helix transcriptional regulator [Clostridium botulinum]|uniref:helix-turn-helix transcriptional regulator n=1 Tax=Clostridium botulinum TaxID=1491 RepID=UPI00077392B4|nr:helix-turn-helix transcriptional regulator [Clostridium botulinum]NFL40094.1 helix-turn-helix transcriptional regulator [Clostridium botulinum]NFL67173.1 helix-turn-helix transcriptional regulator [Clostridium botulinum]NFN09969.1 helix-turn-helix transcriptional regulator [Clostridium botulinum]NFN33487.1 helix-turn-helix transcriptional regulator [Clostridium botulinum]
MTLKKEREKQGLTQEELADKADLLVRTLQRIEQKNTCNVKTAIKLEKALGVPVKKIFDEE